MSGGREREPPSEIQFALNIASIVRFVKGCGLLHRAFQFFESWVLLG